MEGEESIGQWPACSEVAAAELAVASRPSAAARTRRSVQAIFDEVRWFENLVSEKKKEREPDWLASNFCPAKIKAC